MFHGGFSYTIFSKGMWQEFLYVDKLDLYMIWVARCITSCVPCYALIKPADKLTELKFNDTVVFYKAASVC